MFPTDSLGNSFTVCLYFSSASKFHKHEALTPVCQSCVSNLNHLLLTDAATFQDLSFYFSEFLLCVRIPAVTGWEVGYTMDRSSVYLRTNIYRHTETGQFTVETCSLTHISSFVTDWSDRINQSRCFRKSAVYRKVEPVVFGTST